MPSTTPRSLGPGTPNPVYFGTDRLYRVDATTGAATVVSQAPGLVGIPSRGQRSAAIENASWAACTAKPTRGPTSLD